jgi:MraZ protein
MFLGEYIHTFDPKNRISVPARFRKELGKIVVLTRGLDRCLYVYSRKAWEKEAKKYAETASGNAASRGLARLFLAGSAEADVDQAGRILIPENLRSFAGLRAKAIVAGVADRVEIWDEDAWKAYTAAIERDADQFAEKVGTRI